MANELVPFGKYKGQPIEVLLADTQYIEWLSTMPFVKERYPTVHTLIVNNFGEPSETPEHNAFQARFFEEDYTDKFLHILLDKSSLRKLDWKEEHLDHHTESEVCGWDIHYDLEYFGNCSDLFYNAHGHYDNLHIFVEIKPTIGDDFPAIIRQVRNNQKRTNGEDINWVGYRNRIRQAIPHYGGAKLYSVVYGNYVGVGASENVMRKQLESAGCYVFTDSEISMYEVIRRE